MLSRVRFSGPKTRFKGGFSGTAAARGASGDRLFFRGIPRVTDLGLGRGQLWARGQRGQSPQRGIRAALVPLVVSVFGRPDHQIHQRPPALQARPESHGLHQDGRLGTENRARRLDFCLGTFALQARRPCWLE